MADVKMEVSIRHVGGRQFEASARGHRLLCDQPLDHGGKDEGMTPPEILLSALGTCAAYYAVDYLKARQLECKDLAIRVTAGKATQPARMSGFQIEVTAPGLEPARRESLLRALKVCLIHNTLTAGATVESSIVEAA